MSVRCLSEQVLQLAAARLTCRVAMCILASAVSNMVAAQQRGTTATALVLDKVTVVDVERGKRVPDQRVVIIGNRIQEVGAVAKVPLPRNAHRVSARGKYLIPGLWDMHYHVDDFMHGDDVAFQDKIYRAAYPLFIAYGVTGIREMAQRFLNGTDSFRVWQQAVLNGRRVGPRAIGPSVDLSYHKLVPSSADDARRIIESLKAAGVAFVKYHGEPTDSALLFALLHEARRVNLPVDGHLLTWTASDSGQRSVEHVRFRSCYELGTDRDSIFNERACAPLFARLVRNGTWIVPTLSFSYYGRTAGDNPYNHVANKMFGGSGPDLPPDSVRARWGRLGALPDDRAIGAGQRAGIKVLAGTDGAYFFNASPGFGLHQELVFLVENGGMTSLDALRAATLNPAKFLNGTDSLGSIAPGRLADLVLLDADPLANIRNTSAIRAVVANGRYFDRAQLDSLRTRAEQSWPGR